MMEDSKQDEQAHSKTFVTFRLGDERFALGIEEVREVLVYYPDTTRVPRTHRSMRGLMNLRGNIIPVIDFNERIRGELTKAGPDTCVLIIETTDKGDPVLVGAMADAVEEVVQFTPEEQLPPPRGGISCDSRLIQGLAHRGEDLVMILDLNHVLIQSDLHVEAEAVSEAL